MTDALRASTLLAFAACGTAPTAPPLPEGAATVVLLHSSRLEGELEPCG